MTDPKISVVIPAWNSEQQLRKNLPEVLKAAAQVDAEVIVVEDASTLDTSLAYLRSLGSRIQVLANQHNLGFARTVNKGVAAAKGDIVVLLNSDVAPEPTCFRRLEQYFHDPALFAVTLNSGEGYAGGVWQRGFLTHFPISSSSTTPSPSLWASGGQAAFSREKWQKLGGMDPLFAPFYWEDVDLGYRAWQRGWHILFAPDARCQHNHEQSVIKEYYGQSVLKTALRNQALFVWKNITDTGMIWDHLRHLPGFCLRHPRVCLQASMRLLPALRARARQSAARRVTDKAILVQWKGRYVAS